MMQAVLDLQKLLSQALVINARLQIQYDLQLGDERGPSAVLKFEVNELSSKSIKVESLLCTYRAKVLTDMAGVKTVDSQ